MSDRPDLTDEQRDVLLDLLNCERGNLPAEIRHSDNTDLRATLRHRLQVVSALLDRLRTAPVG